MKKINSCIILVVALVGFQCNTHNTRQILINDTTMAVGNISRDSSFEGLIKFYNVNNNTLLYSSNYVNNVRTGMTINYFPNGKIASKYSVENNKKVGLSFIYDTSGSLLSSDYYFYDLRVGPHINYVDNIIKQYQFLSFDDELLFDVEYDSLNPISADKLQDNFFFFFIRKYSEIINGDSSIGKEYFIYKPSPPIYNFKYSLVTVDKNLKIQSIVKDFDTIMPWAVYRNSNTNFQNDTFKLALQIIAHDPVSNRNLHLLKKLDESSIP